MADVYYPAISGNSIIDEKILDAYDKTCALEESVETAEEAFQEISIDAGGDVCTTVATVNKLTDVVQSITGAVTSASGTIQVFNGFQNCIAMQVILKRLQMCLLYAKRLVVKIKIKIVEITKKLVIAMTRGKGSGIPDAISTAVNAAFAALGMAINVLIQAIDMLMKMISIGPLGIDGQGMVFFMTPKSFQNSKVNILNPNSAIGDRFPQPIHMVLNEIEKAVDKANAAIKKAAIIAGAAQGAISIMSDNPSFGISSAQSRINPGKIQKLLDIAMDLIPLPTGMPRYEKLKFTNLGFLAFLITGFEPTAHKSFGIPGYF